MSSSSTEAAAAPSDAATSNAQPEKGSRLLPSLFVGLVALIVLLGVCDSLQAPDLPRAQLVAKYGAPPSRFLALASGAHVHYRDQGRADAPVLVLLHGSNSSLHTWEPWVARLLNTFRIVRFDLPGHGLTGPVPGDDYSPDGMASFVEQVRQKLGLSHFFLAGNSMGGHIAWRYTLAHPDAVDRLVLVDASGINHLLPEAEQPQLPLGFKIARTPGLNVLARFITPRSLIEKTVRAVFVDQSLVTDTMIDRYYELLRYPGNRATLSLRAAANVNLQTASRLGEIHAKTLILSGQKDTLVPVQAARIFHMRIPHSTLIEYPDVGHVPMEEIPDRSAGDVRAFLTSTL